MGGMNAKDFFSVADFEKLQEIKKNEIAISVTNTLFRRTVKVNGNIYTLTVSSGRYVDDNSYFMSLWHDFSHKSISGGSRQKYGGTGSKPDLTSYEAFCDDINRTLKRTPDYEEEQEEQIRFF
jgi:hypothetical protein